MSLSVNGSNTKNPYAYLQSLQQQGSSQPSTTAQSDSLSALLAALGQTGADATASPTGTTSSSAATTTTSGSTSAQFDPQTLQALFAAQASAGSGAPSHTTTNANGSTTTTITYADGSTVTMTTAAPTGGSGSSGSSSSLAGGANVASNNLIEQLIQMQAQLLNPTTTQSVATA